MRWLLCFVVIALLGPAVKASPWRPDLQVRPDGAPGQARLVAAANVRLRSDPSEEVKIVATVPLGTNVAELEATPDRQWVKVRTADGREGWMRDGLSRRVPEGQFLRVAQGIVRDRLARKGDGFASWIELQAFIDQVREDIKDRELEARFALYRLQAIAATAAAGERYNRPLPTAFAEWLDLHKPMLARNESGAMWMLRREVILAEHDRFKDTREGDLIAWFAVTNGLPGECEGFVVCYLTRDDYLWGEYLRRLPSGAFVEAALRDLRERLAEYRELARRADLLDPATECKDFGALLTRIRDAVTAVDAAGRRTYVAYHRDRALVAIDELRASAPACKADRFMVQHR